MKNQETRIERNRNKGLVASALTSTIGIFISKFLGIAYVIPFNRIIGDYDISFYSYAYTIYDYLLTLSVAGIPLAISMVVSKYFVKEDYSTILLIKKVGRNLLLATGICAALLLILTTPMLAELFSPTGADAQYLKNVRIVMYIISFALAIVPVLSFYRGYYQGQREFGFTATSEIIQQISRVTFLLISVIACVYFFNQPKTVAVYWAVGSTVFAAIICLIYVLRFDSINKKEMADLAIKQVKTSYSKKLILKELIMVGMPFLLTSLLGNANGILNMIFFNNAMSLRGESIGYTTSVFSMINFSTFKITSIPQVVAIGFGAAIIPLLSAARVADNYSLIKKQVNQTLITASYIALPLVFCIFVFATPIYAVFYGYSNYILGGSVLEWASLIGLTYSIFGIGSSMILALSLRKEYIKGLIIWLLVKLTTTYLIVYLIGYPGAFITTAIADSLLFISNLYHIKKVYGVSYRKYYNYLIKIVMALLLMLLTVLLLRFIGFNFNYNNQLMDLLYLIIYGVIVMSIYLLVTYRMNLPQEIFNLDLNVLKVKIREITNRIIKK
ncbi:MAG: oligosaccharide flippase family protein [Erysipelotrichaceae bacterium]